MFKKITSIRLRWWASGILLVSVLSWLIFPIERTKRWINPDQFKVGEISHKTIISPLDVLYPDLQATQKAKEQVIEDVPLVYDLSLERLSDADQMFAEIDKIRQQDKSSTSQKLSLMRRLIVGESLTSESSTILVTISNEKIGQIRSGVKQLLREILSQGVVKDLNGSEANSFARNLEKLQPRGEIWKKKYSELSASLQREVSDLEIALHMPIEIQTDENLKNSVKPIMAGKLYDWSDAILEASKKANLIFGSDTRVSRTVAEICRLFIRPNLSYNNHKTEFRRKASAASIKSVMRTLHSGERIISRGEVITEEHLKMLEAIKSSGERTSIFAIIGIAISVIFSTAILAIYLKMKEQQILKDLRKLLTLCLLLVLTMALGRLIIEYIPISQPALLIPTALTSMIVAIIMSTQLAILVTVVLGIFIIIMVGPSSQGILEHFMIPFVGGVVAIFSVSSVRKRSDLVKASLYVAMANVVAIASLALIKNYSLSLLTESSIAGVVNGMMVGMLSPGLLLIFENLAQTTTDIELLELSDLNHPLLTDLKAKAPGSYYHSMEVSQLCEAAAEAIGANALLARVGSYYHDVGKMNLPKYFIENQDRNENIHDKISPYTSARVICSHVKDGIELAKEYKLPKVIEDLIPQHHGTAMISFFYQKALESEDGDDIKENDYRYPGPKPQTKEAGIMLLADSVEASSRNIKESAYSELQNLVEDIINQKLIDSQLDESGLTLKDLRLIADSFVQVLSKSSHLRIEYPKKKGQETNGTLLNINLKAVMTSQRPSPQEGQKAKSRRQN